MYSRGYQVKDAEPWHQFKEVDQTRNRAGMRRAVA